MRGVAVCSRVADATSRAVALVRAGETRDTGATPRPTWARSLVFVGAGVSDVIGAFVGAVVAVMRATPVHDAHSSSTARRPDWRPLDREAWQIWAKLAFCRTTQ